MRTAQTGARVGPTDLVLICEHIRFVHEYLEVQIRMLVICSDDEVDELLYRLLVEVLQ